MCGGTFLSDYTYILLHGLSPRVRGNPLRLLGDGRYRGSIPACAGEPALQDRGGLLSEVYPRVCGGTRTSVLIANIAMGLSPRVRGNRSAAASTAWEPRSIPACAGEPRSGGLHLYYLWVYPRVCGGTQV